MSTCPPSPACAQEPLTAHRLVLGGVLLAAKLYDDRHCANTFFARVGGLPPGELAAVEVGLAGACGFRLAAQPDVLRAYAARLAGGDLVLGQPGAGEEGCLALAAATGALGGVGGRKRRSSSSGTDVARRRRSSAGGMSEGSPGLSEGG